MIGQPNTTGVHQPTTDNQSTNQLTINQQINQSTNQSIDQSIICKQACLTQARTVCDYRHLLRTWSQERAAVQSTLSTSKRFIMRRTKTPLTRRFCPQVLRVPAVPTLVIEPTRLGNFIQKTAVTINTKIPSKTTVVSAKVGTGIKQFRTIRA